MPRSPAPARSTASIPTSASRRRPPRAPLQRPRLEPRRPAALLPDSLRRTIWVYDYDLATGAIDRRRPFAEVPAAAGIPDGLCIDAAGCVWSAHWGGSRPDPLRARRPDRPGPAAAGAAARLLRLRRPRSVPLVRDHCRDRLDARGARKSAGRGRPPGPGSGRARPAGRPVRRLMAMTGKAAVVTGGSTGIGLASALALADAGAKVALCSDDPATLEPALAHLRRQGEAIAVQHADHVRSRGAGADRAGRERLRRPRLPGQQRRHPDLRHRGRHPRGGLGSHARGQSQGPISPPKPRSRR